MKDASVYKYHLLTQQAGENQAFSALRRLRWIEAVGSTSVSTAVEQICQIGRVYAEKCFCQVKQQEGSRVELSSI